MLVFVFTVPALLLALVSVATTVAIAVPPLALPAELLQLHPQEAVFAREHFDAQHLGRRLGGRRRRRRVARVRAADLAADSIRVLRTPRARLLCTPLPSRRHVREALQLVGGQALEAVARPLWRDAE